MDRSNDGMTQGHGRVYIDGRAGSAAAGSVLRRRRRRVTGRPWESWSHSHSARTAGCAARGTRTQQQQYIIGMPARGAPPRAAAASSSDHGNSRRAQHARTPATR